MERTINANKYKLSDVIPMGHQIQFPWSKCIQTIIFGLTLFPLRVIILLISMIPSFLIGLLTDRFVNPDIRPVGWRYLLSQSAVRLGQVQLYIAGIVFDKTGEPADPSEAPILVVGPHSTIIDGFCLLQHAKYHDLPSPTAAIENTRLPLIGPLINICRPLVIDRDSAESKFDVIKQLKSRVKSQYPQSALFPEGTNSNGKALMTFKPGAFIPGAPVQPILLRFSGWDTFTWTFAQKPTNLALLVFLTLSQPVIRFTMEYLPVYNPSKKEQTDHMLYARNVRDRMAVALSLGVTDWTFENGILLDKALELGFEASIVNFNVHLVAKETGLTWRQMRSLLIEFKKLNKDCSETIPSTTLENYSKRRLNGINTSFTFVQLLLYFSTQFKQNSPLPQQEILYYILTK